MLQPDRVERVMGNGFNNLENNTIQNPYVKEFEERFSVLKPLNDNQTFDVRFDMSSIGLRPDKFTAAIFYDTGGSFEILLSKKLYSGYSQGDHDIIEDEHPEVGPNPGRRSRSAFIAEMGGMKFVMIGYFVLYEAEEERFRDTLRRYSISMAFGYDGGVIESIIDDKDSGATSVSQYLQVLDRIIFDGLTSQVAELYGLTNTQLLRLRLVNEFPGNK